MRLASKIAVVPFLYAATSGAVAASDISGNTFVEACRTLDSSYQAQGLKPSKHFRPFGKEEI